VFLPGPGEFADQAVAFGAQVGDVLAEGGDKEIDLAVAGFGEAA
jgi:hypothetical protein